MTLQQQWEWLQSKVTTTPHLLEYKPPPINLPTLILVAIVVGTIAYLLGTRTKAAARERKMRKEREQEVRRKIGDAVVEAIEDLVHNSELKRDEAGFWYRRIGHVLTLPDVLSKNTQALKERLQAKHGKTNVVQMPKKKVGDFLKKKSS